MKFSVIGLPHYTVWHLYEPSVDDIRHMEEMEQERKNREREEKERADRLKKIKDEFHEPNSQWEKDKTELKDIAQKEEEKADTQRIAHVGDEQGPIAQPTKDPTDPMAQSSKDKGGIPSEDLKKAMDTKAQSPKGNSNANLVSPKEKSQPKVPAAEADTTSDAESAQKAAKAQGIAEKTVTEAGSRNQDRPLL